MQLIKTGIVLASAAALMALGGCSAEKDAKPAAQASKEPVAATVNGTPITQRMVDMMVKQRSDPSHPDTPENRKAIIDHLTLQMVIADEAVKKGLDKTPEVTDQLEAVKQSVLATAYVQDYIKNNPVTDEMLKAEYDRIKATVKGTEYRARHILVEKEAEARDIIARLKKDPGAFEKLAMERSKDQGSKARGGELGWFDLSRMVPEFGDAVSKLEKGKITQEPVKTRFGYHVIQLEDSRPIEAPPLDDVKPQLTQQVQQQNVMKQIDTLKAAAKIDVAAAAPAAPAPSAAPAAPAAPATSAPTATPAAPAPK
jgi:peptidyl-prolyl cis-trans isomerase C